MVRSDTPGVKFFIMILAIEIKEKVSLEILQKPRSLDQYSIPYFFDFFSSKFFSLSNIYIEYTTKNGAKLEN